MKMNKIIQSRKNQLNLIQGMTSNIQYKNNNNFFNFIYSGRPLSNAEKLDKFVNKF